MNDGRYESSVEELAEIRSRGGPLRARLVKLFARQGWTQEELAEMLYVTQSTVSRYLNGEVKIPTRVEAWMSDWERREDEL